mmetsp:Transcript_9314/g.20156  ORF Transcript_9314/g.20156 Transcript_9314/m.20156 type:complete len:247 (-) Transcript_9314:4695-5435(-)
MSVFVSDLTLILGLVVTLAVSGAGGLPVGSGDDAVCDSFLSLPGFCGSTVFSAAGAGALASFSTSLAAGVFSFVGATSVGAASVLAAADSDASSFCFKLAISSLRELSAAFALFSASFELLRPVCIFCIIFFKFPILLLRASTSASDFLRPSSAFLAVAWASAIFLLASLLELTDTSFSFLLFSSAVLNSSMNAFCDEISLLSRVTRPFVLVTFASACSFFVLSDEHSSFNLATFASACACSSGSI